MTTMRFASLITIKAFRVLDEDISIGFITFQEMVVLIQSVELVALPNAPTYQEKVYRAHLSTGDCVDLFQAHYDVPLLPESLVGLSVNEARSLQREKMLTVAMGHH